MLQGQARLPISVQTSVVTTAQPKAMKYKERRVVEVTSEEEGTLHTGSNELSKDRIPAVLKHQKPRRVQDTFTIQGQALKQRM